MHAPEASLAQPRPLAVVGDVIELQLALRQRAEELDISREAIDELAGLTPGHSSKLLCDPPMKRLGPISMWPLVGALGLAIALVESEHRMVRVRKLPKRIAAHPPEAHWRHRRLLRMVAKLARTNGAKGGRARVAKLSAEELSRQMSRLANARWRKSRAMGLKAQERA
jgi:hypothetical protein